MFVQSDPENGSKHSGTHDTYKNRQKYPEQKSAKSTLAEIRRDKNVYLFEIKSIFRFSEKDVPSVYLPF